MILIIDTTGKECQVGLQDGKKLDVKKWNWKKDTGTEVLQNIEKMLKKHKKTLDDIKAIKVNQIPGSFTGTRVGITLAKTLSWALKIPILSYKKSDNFDILK